MVGLKLQAVSQLEDEQCKQEVSRIARELREGLIAMGMRKRKVKKEKTETGSKKKGK
jgi:hypothetical protein